MGREGNRNRVFTRANLSSSLPSLVGLTGESFRAVSRSKRAVAMRSSNGLSIDSLAVATQKSGPTSWELSRLQARTGAEETVGELINAVCQAVYARGAMQLAARTLMSDPLGDELRQAGLFPSRGETLFLGAGTGKPKDLPAGVRPSTPADEHGLFRLYSACTPSEVRALEGMTLDQWAASRWAAPQWPAFGGGLSGRVSEYVLETGPQNMGLVGWLRVVRRFAAADIAVMLHPERSLDDATALLGFGLSSISAGKAVNLLVPEYETAVRSAAEDAGLTIEAELQVHVRAARATEKILKEVGAYNVVSP
jgi:hypothetical protein